MLEAELILCKPRTFEQWRHSQLCSSASLSPAKALRRMANLGGLQLAQRLRLLRLCRGVGSMHPCHDDVDRPPLQCGRLPAWSTSNIMTGDPACTPAAALFMGQARIASKELPATEVP